ncbi:hypothetical protein GTP45_09300 [Pseudoduganella sp. FT55W]|uniref:Uncharacterized protein n=1 Tax=Duganella rivi TaxID=2666083 RepID=A0A7X4GP54_9BURK|nr:hypothetical protein [Duganella rivi]MYM67023.1 hypothetical protein [Duganella rivi]
MRPVFDASPYLWADDGSLRDVYIQQMGSKHWERFDSLVSKYELSYSFDGAHAQFPGSQAVFANREGSHLLSVILGQVSVNCHFFVDWQLELDISPREILGPIEHDAVLDFVEQLSVELELPADITPENSETTPFMTYSPTTHSWTLH